MSVRPQPNGAPRVGCCSRLASRISDARARARARKAHRRLAEEAASEGLTAKLSTVTRTDGKPIGGVQMIAGEMVEITAIQVARPTPRERLFGTRLVSLRKEGTYVGTIAVDIRRNRWTARPPIDAHSITSGGAGAPYDSEIERGIRYALKCARF